MWLDFLRRSLIDSGELGRLIAEDGLAGLTSNPAIFQKAIEGNADYTAPIARIAKEAAHQPARQVFERLAVADVRAAADVLAPVFRETQGADGFVSLEVAPDLARDTAATIQEGRRLWRDVERPNLMIKVPATPEGLAAISTLLGEGINVNITLLFARAMYERVAEAYLGALEKRLRAGERVDHIASVASFFVSRIDTAVDERIAQKLAAEASEAPALAALAGKVAVANAKLAYQSYRRIYSGARWEALRAAGARPQRLLWASTGTKNPRYSDVLYVDELIGRDTVNTMPPETLAAYRDHGRPSATLETGLAEAHQVLEELGRAGISLDELTDQLVVEGLQKFVEPYNRLLAALEVRLREFA